MPTNNFDLERNLLYNDLEFLLGLPRAELRPEASLNRDLDIDALDTFELVEALEQDFAVQVPDEDLESIETLADLERYMFVDRDEALVHKCQP